MKVALIFAGVFLALTFLAGSLGWLGAWELLVIAAAAGLLTWLIARSGGRRGPPD